MALNEERSWFTLIVYDIDLDGTFSKAAILCVVYKLVHMADLTMAFYNIMSWLEKIVRDKHSKMT